MFVFLFLLEMIDDRQLEEGDLRILILLQFFPYHTSSYLIVTICSSFLRTRLHLIRSPLPLSRLFPFPTSEFFWQRTMVIVEPYKMEMDEEELVGLIRRLKDARWPINDVVPFKRAELTMGFCLGELDVCAMLCEN